MNLLKRFGAMLMAVVMVMTMLPVTALAAEGPTVTMNTTAITDGTYDKDSAGTLKTSVISDSLTVGSTFYIPVILENMDQFNALNLQFEYDNTVLKFTGAVSSFSRNIEVDGETITSTFAKTMINGTNPTVNTNEAIVAWATDAGVSNDTATTYGYLFFAGFEVIAKSLTGTETIGVKSSVENAAGISMTNVTTGEITYVSGEVSVEQAEISNTLSITNGAQSWNADSYSDLVSIMEAGSGLTAPGSDYSFAGFFTGLDTAAASGGAISEEGGYYVISAAGLGHAQTGEFTGITELRPRYDTIDESTVGNYNALWLKSDISDQIVYSTMRVLPENQTIAVTVYASSDTTALAGFGTTMLTNDFAATTTNGYVKLLTTFAADKSVSGNSGMHLDMNGRSFTGKGLWSSGNSSVVSSYGNGTITMLNDSNLNVKDASVIRDLTLVDCMINCTSGADVDLIENVTSNRGISTYDCEINEISHCKFENSQIFYFYLYTNSGTNQIRVRNIHDTVLSQIQTDGIELWHAPFRAQLIGDSGTELSVVLELGEGNTVTTSYSTLFNLELDTGVDFSVEFRFTDVNSTYSAANNPFPAMDHVSYTFPEGYIMTNDNGNAKFIQGNTVTYKSYDGSETLAVEYVPAGSAANLADHVAGYDLTAATIYKHVGWAATANSTEALETCTPSQNVTLYAVRQAVTDVSEAASVKLTLGSTVSYHNSLQEAVEAAIPVTEEYWNSVDGVQVVNLITRPSGALRFDLLRDTYMDSNVVYVGYDEESYNDIYEHLLSVGNNAVTIDLNGHTLKLNTEEGRECFRYGSGNESFTIQSTGSKGEIVVGDGVWNLIGGYPFEAGQQVTVKNVDISASTIGGAGLFVMDSYGENVTLNLEDVTFSHSKPTVAVWNGGGSAADGITVNLTDCDLTSTGSTVISLPWTDDSYTDGRMTVNVSGEDTALAAANNAYPIDSRITENYIKVANGYALTDPDGDGTYTLNKLHTHTYGEPTWNWTEAGDGYTATATFTCTEGDDTQTINATVTSETVDGKTTYTATADFAGQAYTATKEINSNLTIGGSEVGEEKAPEAAIPEDSTYIEVENADQLDDLDSLTVKKDNVVLKFLADALNKIAENVTGNAKISVESKDTTVSGAVARFDFDVTDDKGNKVSFQGSVEVEVPFTPAEGKSGSLYRAFHMMDGGKKEPVDTKTVQRDDQWYAQFKLPHFSGVEIAPASESGYIAGLNSTTLDVYTNNTVTVNVGVSSAGSDTHFNAAEVIVTYPTDLLTLTALTESETFKYTDTNGTVKIEMIGEETAFATNNFPLNFTAKAEGTATVTLTSAAFAHEDNVATEDLKAAAIYPASVEVEIGTKTYNVNLPEGDTSVNGATVAEANKDYSFTVTQDPYCDYTVKATIGNGDPITLEGVAGENNVYTYTITADKVTGDISIEVTKTAKTFNVTINKADGTTETGTATYNQDYKFNVPVKAQWQYNYTIKINNVDYNGAQEGTAGTDSKEVTIPGSAITGDITITITGVQTEFNVTGNTGTITGGSGENGSFKENDKPILTIEKKPGYKYTVTAVDADGNEVTVIMNTDGTYTTEEGITSDITFTVKEELIGTVQVYTYLTLNADATDNTNSKTMFLVTYTDATLTEGNVPYYGAENTTSPMLWSDEYQAYSWLVIVDNGTLSAEDAAMNVSIRQGTKADVSYSMDINGTKKIDAADAQFVYNMYKAMYSSFDQVSIAKFLAADQNGDALTATRGAITVADATTIISAILDSSAK